MLGKHFSLLITALTLLLIFIVTGALLSWYLNLELQEMIVNVQEVASLRTDGAQELAILTKARETALARGKIESYFVNPKTVTVFIEQVESLARTSEIKLTLNQAVAKESLYLELYAEGEFSGLMNFLKRLENLPFRLEINQANITKLEVIDDKASSAWSLAATLNLLSYEQ